MSASRLSLLAAAALGSVLTPTAPCWAQAYGAASVVEHNDLRWFEPVELDIDGQMPHRDAGWFGSMDKLFEATSAPRVEIGHQGLTVDSERVYRAPSNDLAFTALEQVEGFGFVDSANEALSYSGIRFVVANTQGTESLSDDVVTSFNTAGFGTVAQLQTAVNAFNADAANIAANREIRVGGEPRPYQVKNGIQDALPDAGFAWGERYEFGYSDGEQGWMISLLDGPESVAGGTWGAGPLSPFTSQSGQAVFGPDPAFLGDLQDDDGDGLGDGDADLGGTLFALGFGSVAVNFNLPSPDFLDGYRDYVTNGAESGGTTTGPVLYVGNYGAVDVDNNSLINLNGLLGGGTTALNADDALFFANQFNIQQTLANPSEGLLTSQVATIISEINQINGLLAQFAGGANPIALQATTDLQTALTTALGLQFDLNQAVQNGTMTVSMDQFATEIAALITQLTTLDGTLSGLSLTQAATGNNTGQVNNTAATQLRAGDDLDGNGNAVVTRVLADIDGDGIIEAGEIVGIINNFGDLHRFNVFFDQVTVRNVTEMDGVELMRTHQLSTRHKLEQGRWDNLRMSYGLRFLSVKDDFYFQGEGSILGLTTVETDVENQIIGPQLGLQWVRNDGPWSFVMEGRGTLGYNISDVDQYGIFGSELIPGALNRPVVARTTTTVNGTQFEEFSPLGELRAMLKYRLANSISLQAGYTGKFIANIHRGSQATAFNAPDYGIHDHKGDIFTNGLSFGVELRH